jgi:hypothetical protein
LFSLELVLKFTVEEFRAWKHKKVTLLGMSGVGKSYLSAHLHGANWFHYSGDYRIGTRYLDEHILDMIKQQAMQVPFLRELLRNDWIYFRNNIRVDNLGPVLSFVGKLGNPELGGVALDEFNRRQAIYRQAEIDAMLDIPDFIQKAEQIYGYPHFVNDVGGSLCELDEPGVIQPLIDNTLILYIKIANQEQEDKLHAMAKALMKYETIDQSQVKEIMEGHDPTPPEDWEDSGDSTPAAGKKSKDSDPVGPIGDPAGEH